MSNAHDRRAASAPRIPFEAMVEVGGSLGPSFEAQAVNLSEDGMSMRTAYLPEVGQPVMCRFDAGSNMTVVAAGEVLWNEDLGNGGEFGIRFTNLDAPSTVALQRILGMAEDAAHGPNGGDMAGLEPGRKVRLHIDGLASPMRARIKDRMQAGVTAYSELGFLQMGKQLDLEDAQSGNRRAASIDKVQVELDQASKIPQLIISLRYDDAQAAAGGYQPENGIPLSVEEGRMTYERSAHVDHGPDGQQAQDHGDDEHDDGQQAHGHDSESAMAMSRSMRPSIGSQPAYPMHEGEGAMASMGHEAMSADHHASHASHASHDENHDEAFDDGQPNKLKSAFARNAAKVTPALLSWAKRAKIAAAILAAKAKRTHAEDDVEIAPRRMTAPAPGGGLTTAGRKVVRGSVPEFGPRDLETEPMAKGKFAITKKKLGVASAVGIAGLLVFVAMRKPAPAIPLATEMPADTITATPPDPNTPPASTTTSPGKPVPPPADPLAAAAQQMSSKPGKATPFSNGNVGSKPNVIKIKMDGNIEGIQGASQPTGFTVVIPNRKSVEPTASLGEKDPRIAAIRVANEAGGAEFSVAFKDGVPNYIVRAHGDVLEMVLAREAAHGDKAEASRGGGKKHHGKKHHEN